MGLIDAVLEHLTLKFVVSLIVIALVLKVAVGYFDEHVRLRKLPGAKARPVPDVGPLGLRAIYRNIQAGKMHKNYEHWDNTFRSIGSYTVELRLVGQRVVMTADPENIKAVLATQFKDFGKGKQFHREWSEFLGDSIFTTDGDLWHTSRQLIRPQFIRDRVSDLHCFESHMDTLFRAMANGGPLNGEDQAVQLEAGNGRIIDISDLFFRYTLDVATDFLLGHDVKSMSTPKEDFADAFNEVQRVQVMIARSNKLSRFIDKRSFRAGLGVMNKFVYQFIEHTLSLSPDELASKAKTDQGYTFLHELAGFTRDRKVLRDQIVAVLLAGRDTTACTLSWTLYELARHPKVVARLRREIAERVGFDRPPTYEDLKSMKYLQNVTNETLRLYPVVPFNVRIALHDTTLPRGGGPDGSQPVPVTKGTPVGYSTLVMQRREDMAAGAGAAVAPHDVYSPDRWDHWQPKPWTYVPFNGGPRICVGQQFALAEMGYVLCRMFQRFERVESFMGEVDGGTPVMKTDVVLAPAQGVKVAFYEAKKAA